MPAPAWTEPYIGIPFKDRGCSRAGCDCWGLCRLISREHFGIDLPDYEYVNSGDRRANGELVRVFASGLEWREVGRDGMRAGDIVVIRVFGNPSHVGMVLDSEFFINTKETLGSFADRFYNKAVERRIDGVYRYVG